MDSGSEKECAAVHANTNESSLATLTDNSDPYAQTTLYILCVPTAQAKQQPSP